MPRVWDLARQLPPVVKNAYDAASAILRICERLSSVALFAQEEVCEPWEEDGEPRKTQRERFEEGYTKLYGLIYGCVDCPREPTAMARIVEADNMRPARRPVNQ